MPYFSCPSIFIIIIHAMENAQNAQDTENAWGFSINKGYTPTEDQ